MDDVYTALQSNKQYSTADTNIMKPAEMQESMIKPDKDHYPSACFIFFAISFPFMFKIYASVVQQSMKSSLLE